MAYVKLFNSILASTIWREPATTRVLWITMLALADRDGMVEASVPGLADMARLSDDEVRRALLVFSSPDPDSRTQDNEGRRLKEVRGGWMILNYEYYRDKQSKEDLKESSRLRQARKRTRDLSRKSQTSQPSPDVPPVTPSGSGSDQGTTTTGTVSDIGDREAAADKEARYAAARAETLAEIERLKARMSS